VALSTILKARKGRKESAICAECGETFERTVIAMPDGAEVPGSALCPVCDAKQRDADEQQRLSEEVDRNTAAQRETWMKDAGIGDLFKMKGLDKFNATLQPAAFKAINEWNGRSLVLTSQEAYGLGKTHLVAGLATRLIETTPAAGVSQGSVLTLPRPVLFTSEQRLMGRIRATFNTGAKETDEAVSRLQQGICPSPGQCGIASSIADTQHSGR